MFAQDLSVNTNPPGMPNAADISSELTNPKPPEPDDPPVGTSQAGCIGPPAQTSGSIPLPTAEVFVPPDPVAHAGLMETWLRILAEDGQVVELRALDVSTPDHPGPHVVAGYYDAHHYSALATDALRLTEYSSGVYKSLNPLRGDILARRPNGVAVVGRGVVATDKDVTRRRYLLIDADPVRPGKLSATNTEKAAAGKTILAVREQLTGLGWPAPILADSGNGYHLLFRIDLPVDDGGLVKAVLRALALRHDSSQVEIDTSVFNPEARLCKFYGTLARKGDSTPERPHRWSGILQVPDIWGPVSEELLWALAAEAPASAGCRRNASVQSRQDSRKRGKLASVKLEYVQRRARAYLATIAPAISGQRGHDQTFKAACKLVQGFGLDVEDARPLLAEWNESCVPPWTEAELCHKLEDAAKQDGERGYLLNGDGSHNDDIGRDGPGDDELYSGAQDGDGPQEAHDDPLRLARLFLEQQHTVSTGLTLRYSARRMAPLEERRLLPVRRCGPPGRPLVPHPP